VNGWVARAAANCSVWKLAVITSLSSAEKCEASGVVERMKWIQTYEATAVQGLTSPSSIPSQTKKVGHFKEYPESTHIYAVAESMFVVNRLRMMRLLRMRCQLIQMLQ
jgi:hypothetical protein